MLGTIFCNKTRVFILILVIVEFFDFLLIPGRVRNLSNIQLSFLILLLFVLSFVNTTWKSNYYEKKYSYIMALFAIAIALNCWSCLYYRNQSVFETFTCWAPLLIFYLYYPLSKMRLSSSDVEKILYLLFICATMAHLVQTIFPNHAIFEVETSEEKFENDLRVRLFSDAVLFLGNIYCFNKLLVSKGIQLKLLFVYVLSFVMIFLMGFRMLIFVTIVVSIYIYIRIHKADLVRFLMIGSFLVVLFIGLMSVPLVQERVSEIIERNETDNFKNDDYVRVVLFNYYYSDYFKDYTEMVLGSGMVRRIVEDNKTPFPSQYSKEVSYNSEQYHFYPVDMGMIGLSWEAGIPAFILMNIICIYLLFSKLDKRYMYINGWGLFLLLIQITSPFYYYHHNLIYTVLIWLLLVKIKEKENRYIQISKQIIEYGRNNNS